MSKPAAKTKAKRDNKRRWPLLVLCYLAAVVVWFAACGILLLRDTVRLNAGQLPATHYGRDDLAFVAGVKWDADFEENGWFYTTETDPRVELHFPEGRYANLFIVQAETLLLPSGQLVLYYTTAPGEELTPSKALRPARDADGRWVFDLGGRKVYKLRFDPGDRPGVMWRLDDLVLTETKPPYAYFLPGARGVFLLLVLPLLAFAVISEVVAFLKPVFARRRFESRWQDLERQD